MFRKSPLMHCAGPAWEASHLARSGSAASGPAAALRLLSEWPGLGQSYILERGRV